MWQSFGMHKNYTLKAVDDSHSIDFTQMSLFLNSRYAWLILKKKEPFIHARSSQPYVSTFKSAWIQREWKYWRKRGAAPEGININIMARNSGKLKPIMSALLVRSRKSFCFLSLPRALNMHYKKEFRDQWTILFKRELTLIWTFLSALLQVILVITRSFESYW